MKNNWFTIVLMAVVFAGAASLVARGEEKEEKEEKAEKIAFAQVPAAAQRTLTDEAKGAKIETVDKEAEEGKTIYEVDVKISGKNYEIKVAEDGTLVSKKLDEDEEHEEKDEKAK